MLNLAAFMFVFSLLLLGGAASFIVDSLSEFAKKIGMSNFIIGSVILAIGTTIPEFADMIIANMKGVAGLGVGAIIGSVVTNLCLIFGIVAILQKKERKVSQGLENHIYLFALFSIILFIFLGFDNTISRIDGLIMAAFFVAYQMYLYKIGINKPKRSLVFRKLSRYYIIIPLAIIVIIISAGLVVESGTSLATMLGVTPAVIGLILVSFGTSVPELFSSIIAVVKEKQELSFGNLFGANIADILMILGFVALFHPIQFTFNTFILPVAIAILSTLFFVSYTNLYKKVDKKLGYGLISFYIIYLFVVLL